MPSAAAAANRRGAGISGRRVQVRLAVEYLIAPLTASTGAPKTINSAIGSSCTLLFFSFLPRSRHRRCFLQLVDLHQCRRECSQGSGQWWKRGPNRHVKVHRPALAGSRSIAGAATKNVQHSVDAVRSKVKNGLW